MTIMNSIRATLETKLSELPDAPVLSFENSPYAATTGVTFINTHFVPTSIKPATRGLNPQLRYQGTFIMKIYSPSNQGAGPALDLVDAILTHFPATVPVTANGFTVSTDYVEVGSGFLDSPFYVIPVTLAWYVYHQ